MSHTLPSTAELLEFAKSNQGIELKTLHQNKPFQVFVKNDELYFRPKGDKERRARTFRVNGVLAKLHETGSWSPSDYAGKTFNASYLLALIRAWQTSKTGNFVNISKISAHSALNEEQKELVKKAVWTAVRNRNCDLREDRLVHGFHVECQHYKKTPWIGSVYWSENNETNDVEIAFNLTRLAMTSDEIPVLDFWFRTTASRLQNVEPRNHSGDDATWYRAGFQLSEALDFFSRLAKQTSPFTSHQERWKLDHLPTPRPFLVEATHLSNVQDPITRSLGHMLSMARQACEQSGKVRTTVAKKKAFLFKDDAEFKQCISDLLSKQNNCCAITNLPLQFLGDYSDEEFLASLDRIDSNGDYSFNNVQVVCRFINRWKNDDTDLNFKRLVKLLKI